MTTKLADEPQTEAAKKAVEEEKKASDRSRAEYIERTKGKPTPTQAENDLAMHGAHILEHEADGSDPDPHNFSKSMEADKPAGKPQSYATRQQKAE
jgi:hypothetical protein